MEVFGLLFLVVALVLVGIGIAIGVIACGIAAVLISIGVLSSSVVIGMIARRLSAGFRAFLLQCALLAGIPAGLVCAWLIHWSLSAVGSGWLISAYGALGGAVAGLIMAFLLEFTLRRFHRWASAKTQ